MDLRSLRPYLFWYTCVAALVTAALLYGLATVFDVAIGLVALVLCLVPIGLCALVFGVSDTGIETAGAGAMVGFGTSNPMDFQPSSLPVPNRVGLVCYFAGLTLVGAGTLAFLLS